MARLIANDPLEQRGNDEAGLGFLEDDAQQFHVTLREVALRTGGRCKHGRRPTRSGPPRRDGFDETLTP